MRSQLVFPNLNNMQVGQFIIRQQLSDDGNMSRVYLAVTHPDYVPVERRERQVALKISRNDNHTYEQALLREVRQLTNLRHPGIVHICPIIMPNRSVLYLARATELAHLFNDNPPLYYAMEVLHGRSLHHHLNSGQLRQLPIEWRLELLYQIIIIIHFLHSAKIAHRDIKPDNIVFRYPPRINERPQPVFVDFGLWAQNDQELMTSVYRAGSLQYLSPERVIAQRDLQTSVRTSRTDNIDHLPSDIWALGIIAYELFHNQHPFAPFYSEEELADKIVHKPHNPPRTSPPMDKLINDMLAKIREDRPTINDVLQRIELEVGFFAPRI